MRGDEVHDMGEDADRMLLKLQLMGRSQATIDAYMRYAKAFVRFHMRSPREMGEPEVRAWLKHVLEEKQAEPDLMRGHIAAVKFLYSQVLDRPEVVSWVPWPRKVRRLPSILSLQEVDALIRAAPNLRMRAFIEAGYGAGLRISEVCRLRTEDVDSKRGILFIHKAKGRKDRIAILPDRLLATLRAYWREVRPPRPWLFPGLPKTRPITRQAIYKQLHPTIAESGVTRPVRFHSLRHSFATHLLEEGIDILTIQEMLGHTAISTTMLYLRIQAGRIRAVGSPLDRLPRG